MKELKKQDKNGVRRASDLERKYKFSIIEPTAEKAEELEKQTDEIEQELDLKVDKVEGKQLSTNDFTNALKSKLEGIEDNAEVNTIESISLKGVPQAVSNRNVDLQADSNLIESISVNGTVQEIVNKNVNLTIAGGVTLLDVYPIGSVYISVLNTSPAILFGGTWESFGTGRVLVGVDTSQTEFNTVEKTGGSKEVTLTTEQIPPHVHNLPSFASGTLASTQYIKSLQGGTYTSASTASTGGGQAHSNLQPYITVYMWKRTN